MRKPNISRKSQRVIDALVSSAKTHGWEEDQGNQVNAAAAKARFEVDKLALERHIASLERKHRKLEARFNDYLDRT